MQVLFDAQDKEGWRLRVAAVNHIRRSTRRLGWLTQRARVKLEAVRGGQAGLDKRCRIEFASGRTPSVVVTSTARDWTGAFDLAVRRAVSNLREAARRAGQGSSPRHRFTSV